MATFEVEVRDLHSDSQEAETGRPLYSAIFVATSSDLQTPLAFHTGYVTGEYLAQIEALQRHGPVAIDVRDGFFDSDLYHQRKEVIRSAMESAGIYDDRL